jgi:hypothetical protein
MDRVSRDTASPRFSKHEAWSMSAPADALFGRGELENGATITMWIDVDGHGAADREREFATTGMLGATCAPAPREPAGTLPPAPFADVITITIHD